MPDSLPTAPGPLDLRTLSPAEVNLQLRALAEPTHEIQLIGVSGQAGLASGIEQPLKIMLSGNVGAYFAMLNAGAELEITGDVGMGCGHSMTAGGILIRGHAGHSLGAFARGGFIGVHGAAKEACGLGLNGADVVVRQTVGARAGHAMRAGNLVLGNDAGAQLGKDCTGGTIYLRGEAASLADNLREVRMRESDAMRLGLLLVRAGIKAATKEFRIYRARVKSEGA
jgi:methylamine---glutamate N-methyltransferase subunit B